MGIELVTPTHLLFLALLALVLFGPKRLPEIGRSLGAGIRDFKESLTAEARPAEDEATPAPAAAPAPLDSAPLPAAAPPPAPLRDPR